MKKKILFSFRTSTGKLCEILSDERWFGSNNVLLTEMTDQHLINAQNWLRQRIQWGKNRRENGFDFKEWLQILFTEEIRRTKVAPVQETPKVKERIVYVQTPAWNFEDLFTIKHYRV